jgi:hypothetical protein
MRDHSIEVLPDDGILGRVNDERDTRLIRTKTAYFRTCDRPPNMLEKTAGGCPEKGKPYNPALGQQKLNQAFGHVGKTSRP